VLPTAGAKGAAAPAEEAMRWTSTHESVEREEVSALALAETAVALGVSYAIYAYTDSLRHVAVAAAVAPFLLLRTRESTERGLRFADILLDFTFNFPFPKINLHDATIYFFVKVIIWFLIILLRFL
jgi:hypothetical protein